MNYVFDGIVERYGLGDKYVLLLEEDHYVSPDALHVLRYMMKNKNRWAAAATRLGATRAFLQLVRRMRCSLPRLLPQIISQLRRRHSQAKRSALVLEQA